MNQFNLPPRALFYADRINQTEQFNQSLLDYQVIFVEGLPGSGRTSFVADYFRKNSFTNSRIVYFCVKANETLAEFTERVRAEKNSLRKYTEIELGKSVNSGLKELFMILTGLSEKSYIIIDDVDYLEDITPQTLAECFMNGPWTDKLVLITSGKPQFKPDKQFEYAEIEIHGLNEELAVAFIKELFKSRGKKIDPDLASLLHKSVQGHPMAIKLLSASILNNQDNDLDRDDIKKLKGEFKKRIRDYSDYFIRVIWKHFSDTEKILLKMVSLFRKPIYLNKLLPIVPERHLSDTAQRLSANFIFDKTDDGRIKLFPVISCLIQGFLKRSDLKIYHPIASRYYCLLYTRDHVEEKLEEIYHLNSAGEYEKCKELLVSIGPDIIKKGFVNELIKWCTSIIYSTGEKHIELLFLMARCHRISGDMKKAESVLTALKSKKGSNVSSLLLARIFYELSIIKRVSGKYKKALALSEQACDLFQKSSKSSERWLADFNKAEIYKDLGEYKFAEQIFDRLVNRYTLNNDYQNLAMTLNSLAVIYKNLGNYEKAESCFFRALGYEEECGNLYGQSIVLNNLSDVCILKGDYEDAEQFNSKCLLIRTRVEDHLGRAMCLNNSAVIKTRTGKYDSALEDLNESLKIKKDFNDQRGISYSLNDIAGIYRSRGEYLKAVETYKKSEAIKRKMSDQRGLVVTLTGLGNIYKDLCEFNKARSVLAEALKIAQKMHLQSEESSILHQFGSFEASTGNMKSAREMFETALRLSERLGNPNETARSMGALAGILKIEGDYKAARSYYLECLEISKRLDDPKGKAITYNQLGSLCVEEKKTDEALDFFRKSLELKESIEDKRGVIETLIPMAKCFIDRKDIEKALETLKRALKLARQLKLIKSEIIIFGFMAEIDINRGNYTQADECLKDALSCCHELDFTEGYAFIYKTFSKLYQIQNDFEKSHFYVNLAIEQYNLLNKLDDIKQLKNSLQKLDKRNLDCLLSEIDANTDSEKLKKLNIRLLDKYGEDLVVIFTDIVGFTLKTETLSEIDIMKLIRDHDTVAESIIIKNNGRIIKKIGDSIMACFSNPDLAVKSSVEFIEALKIYSADKKNIQKIELRIGMNSGLVIKRDDDVFGDVVNTAARLSHFGSPSEIIMTEAVSSSLKNNEYNLKSLGHCHIRGKNDTVSLLACVVE